ncbi:cation-translocating P-type ATPase [Chitinimonas naiadis]
MARDAMVEPGLSGLTEAQAAERLDRDGPNELADVGKGALWRIVREVVTEPMFLLLLGAGGIYLLLGDGREAAMLLGFVVLIIGITILQQQRTAKVLERLRDLSSPRALVLRDGQARRVPGRELVVGDVVLLAEGDRVPADGVLLTSNELAMDESLVSGESNAVHKRIATAAELSVPVPTQQGEEVKTPWVHGGSMVVQGQGWASVTATGQASQLGRIGQMVGEIDPPPSPLQRETRRLVQRIVLIAFGVCTLALLVDGFSRGNWLAALLGAITLAMALLPQELPVIQTVMLALGARRIAAQGVLTRRLDAIESLGETTVLCVDKTGTLTQNRLSVRALSVGDSVFMVDGVAPLPEAFHTLLEYVVLASEIAPHDPIEQAFHLYAQGTLEGTEHLHEDWSLRQEYELTPALLAMTHSWAAPDRDHYTLACKGAAEAVADLCHFDTEQMVALRAQVARLASQGLRVLAVASGRHTGDSWPTHQHAFDFSFLGLIGLADPLRPQVPQAVADCRKAGIRVVMITGDDPGTAATIARQAGIAADEVLTGSELLTLDDTALVARVSQVSVFARIRPEQKLRLVEAFKTRGEVVAMTGDGVNDAPALKAAHIGVAMGKRGSDVAREAATLVLLEDDFTAIVEAMRQGRRIYANLRRAVVYTIAIHLPIIGLAMVPLMFGLPILLAPIHVMFLELVIDPACSLVFEAEPASKDLMRHPPRRRASALFDRATMLQSLLQGSALTLAAVAVYLLALDSSNPADAARSLAFATLVLGNLGLLFAGRPLSRPTPVLLWVSVGTVLALLAALCVPQLARVFHFASPPLAHWLLVAVAVPVGVIQAVWMGKLATWRRGFRPAAPTAP